MISMKNHGLVLVLLFLIFSSLTARVRIIFQVDMRYQVLEAGDRVVIRGSHPLLGEWRGDATELQGNQVFTRVVDFPDSLVGKTIYYKYVILRSDGSEEWESRGNRQLTVPSASRELTPVYFDDVDRPGISHAIAVQFRLDLRRAWFEGNEPDSVALLGGRRPLSWQLPQAAVKLDDSDEDGIWYVTVHFPPNSLEDVAFKFAFYVEGEWQWESLPGHINHVFLLDTSRSVQYVSMRFDEQKGRIVPDENPAGYVDQYGHIIDRLGDRGRRGDYPYFYAVKLLQQGRRSEADSVYQVFRRHHPGVVELDDFYSLWARDLLKRGRVDEAVSFCESQEQEAGHPYRKAHYSYLKGELLLAAGRLQEAKAGFRHTLQAYWDQREIQQYVLYGLALCYLQDGSRDSLRQAIPYLKRLVDEDFPLRWKRFAVRRLARLYHRLGQKQEAQRYYELLVGLGNSVQRWYGQLERLRYLVHNGEPRRALREMERLMKEVPDGRLKAGLQLLQGVALGLSGERAAGLRLLQQVEQQYGNSVVARQARVYRKRWQRR